jgi:hypothetical protein
VSCIFGVDGDAGAVLVDKRFKISPGYSKYDADKLVKGTHFRLSTSTSR